RTTPARRRGGQPGHHRVEPRGRNTPASAGRTGSAARRGPARPEDPRVGGGDMPRALAIGPGIGTPPRRRGGPARRVVRVVVHRNTPASAGRTRSSPSRTRGTSEHTRVGGEDVRNVDARTKHDGTPRVGGEDTATATAWSRRRGTPPRRRGGHPHQGPGAGPRRNTPASAGRTPTRPPRTARSPEHPRVGGEDYAPCRTTCPPIRPPPRRRGGHPHQGPGAGPRRNTPASAGRTPTRPPRTARSPEHPRVGGEDYAPCRTTCSLIGTPPRRRGGRAAPVHDVPGDRNTPASAGRTTAAPSASSRASEHPRVGGEDSVVRSSSVRGCGTPPRRRGGRHER